MNPTLLLEPFSAVLTIGMEALLNTFIATAAVAALAWIALRFVPRVNAATRYAAWWAVLVAIVAIAAVPFLPARDAPAPAVPAVAPAPSGPALEAPSMPALAQTPVPSAPVSALPIEPVEVESGLWILGVFGVWALAALWRAARIGRSYFILRRLRRRARLAPPELASVFDRRRMECGIRRPARLLISNDISAPIAVGFLRPVVMLPESLITEFSPAELDHVLLHELAHVARYDDWTNLVGRAAQAALGLHPVVAFVISRIDCEREIACDDWVVARTGAARPYAASLTRVFELTYVSKPLLASGMAERSSNLGARVERLLERGRQFNSSVSMETLAVSTAMLIGLVFAGAHAPNWIAFAQDAIPMPMPRPVVLDMDQFRGQTLLTQLAYYQRTAPQPPEPPAAPEPPSPPEPPVAPVPPVPPAAPRVFMFDDENDGGRIVFAQVERQAQLDAIRAQLRAAEQQLRENRSAENEARLAELQAQLAAASTRLYVPFNRRPLVQELIDAGMTNLTVDEIIEMSRNGVSPQYVKALNDFGWSNLTRDQIVSLQQNGVSTNYLRQLKDQGLTDLTVDQVIAAARNGVRAQDIKTARTYRRDMSIDDIIKLKQNGAL